MNKPNTTGHKDVPEIEQALKSLYGAPAPSTTYINRLEQQLLGQQKPAHRPLFQGLRWRWAFGFASLVVLLVAALALTTWLRKPQPANAQEIIQKAQASLQSPAANGVQSYVLSETQRSVPLNPRVSGLSAAERTQATQVQMQRWFQAPNRWRDEYTITTLDAQGKVLNSASFTLVSDGSDVWQYSATDGSVTINRQEAGMSGMAGLAPFGENVQNLADLFQRASTCYHAQVSGEARVAGREAYVIDMGPSLCPSASAPEMNGRLTLWVDKETYFVLKQEQLSTQGSMVVQSSEVQHVQYNATIDTDQFTFSPPAGVQVQDMRPKPTPSASQYQAQLGQLAGQLEFPLFAPSYVPQGLAPLQPYPQSAGATQVTLSYVPPEEAAQNVMAGPHGISVQQQRATDSLVAQWTEGTESITLTAVPAWLRRGVHNADGTGSDSAVLVVRDGTLIAVSSFQVAPEELLKVADSLQAVPGGHTALANPTLPTPAAPTTATPAPTPAFNVLRPGWFPEPMTLTEQTDGQMVTLGFDPHPNDAPHAVVTLMEQPKASIGAAGSPDPQARQEQIGGHAVTVIYRGENCTAFDWDQGDVHLTLTNAYDPPGQVRYTCEQMRQIIESVR